MRAHMYRPIQDEHGELLLNSTVEVCDPVSQDPVVANLFTTLEGEETWDNPMIVESGNIDFWLDEPAYVTLKITPESTGLFLVEWLSVLAPPEPG